MNINGWKFERKKKSGLFKKTKWKKKLKKYGLEQKQKEKNEERKKSRSAIWALLCKVSGIDYIWKEKNCAPLVFRNTLCLIYIFSS